MTGISYFIIHLLAITLPGWIIVRLMGFSIGQPVFILATSYIYYVLLGAISKWLDLPLSTFIGVYIILMVVMAVFSLRIHPKPQHQADRQQWLTGLLVVILSYLLYRYLIGPYTEVPADFLRHLEFARSQLRAITEGTLGPQKDIIGLFNQRGDLWYSFYALITSLTGLEFSQTLSWAVLANGLAFLCAVYGFAWYVFGHFTLSANSRLAAALLATLFTASHLGLNIFAYIRYYAMAPTMLNMVIYFAAVIAIIELLRSHKKPSRHNKYFLGLVLLQSLIASVMVHNQEALFILVMGGMVLAWFALHPQSLSPGPVINLQRAGVWSYRIILLLFILGFIGLVVWTYTHHDRPSRWDNKIIQLSTQGPILNRILFLNPGYQGFQVITPWGVLVYALFVIYWRKFISHPYLFAGMLVPIFTVFNPVFVDWFMRLASVHTLWRLLYMVPLHFVAGLLVIFLLASASRTNVMWRKGLAYISMAMLFALLLPLSGLNTNSRLTLAKVDHNNSYVYWHDLIEHLNHTQVKPVSILTDPITGYILKGLTRHRTYYYKFINRTRHRFNFDDYSKAPLAKYKGWLLVVNDRSGGYSEVGGHARHWPGNILNTSDYYGEPLRKHLKSDPDSRFEKIWEKDSIRIYKIH